MNSEWSRRVFIAASKHFQSAADAYPIIMFIEGTDYTPRQKYIEFRLDGPIISQYTKSYYRLDFEINILWSLNIDHDDFHEPQRIIGMLTGAMTDICVYNEDSSFLGTLVLENPITTANYGQIDSDTRLIQGVVFGSYKLMITG